MAVVVTLRPCVVKVEELTDRGSKCVWGTMTKGPPYNSSPSLRGGPREQLPNSQLSCVARGGREPGR
jgi:hypothetical protein